MTSIRAPLAINLTPRIHKLVLGVAILAAAPHLSNLPIPISVLLLLLLVLRFISLQRPRFQPGRWVLMLLTLLGGLLVYSQHHTLMGRDAGVSLLTVMLGMKLLELHKHRDVYVVTFISYFVVITQFLYNQTFLLALYLLFVVVSLTALLLELNQVSPSKQLIEPLKKTLSISLQALPIAAILFILFPRLSQPLWQYGSSDNSALTGLSDHISPGSISQLIQSPEVAFRVKFLDTAPEPEQRYWRALVLWDTDGFDWFNRKQTGSNLKPAKLSQSSHPVAYEIFLEPHRQRWLYALELPEFAPPGSSLSTDFTILSVHPVQRLRHYQLRSNTRYRTGSPSPEEFQRSLSIPDNVTEQERKLVEAWRITSSTDQDMVKLALQYFHQQPFVYTLSPPTYPDNPIHEFLFEGREGFCEHFASSFTLLMRLAGIPARMVLGYQGGEYNPVGEYYILRQYDAHAWSEVWLEQQGWTRIDPTAAVAPERIRHPIQLDLAGIGSPVRFQLDDGGRLNSALNKLRLTLDAANIGWRRWILDYNRARQFNLFNNIGIDFSRTMQWLTLSLGLIGLTMSLIALYILLQGQPRLGPVLKSYQRLCQKLAFAGLPRRPSEGPLDYSRRIARERPDLSAQTDGLLTSYIRLRYGPDPTPEMTQMFRQQVRLFRPNKKA